MTRTGFISLGALAVVAAVHAPLGAQGARDASRTVQLAFGYECGDRFLVRNDGTEPVVIEYAVAGSNEKSQLNLSGRQSAEIASPQGGNLQLWVGGKVVASEPKGNRPCAASQSTPGVTVRPIEPYDATAVQPADAGYTQPAVVVYAPPSYNDYYNPYGYPYAYYPYSYYPYSYYPYSYYGVSPFYYPSMSIYGGYRGGRVFRGRGRR